MSNSAAGVSADTDNVTGDRATSRVAGGNSVVVDMSKPEQKPSSVRIARLFGLGLAVLASSIAPGAAQMLPAWSAISNPSMAQGAAVCTAGGDQGDVLCFGLRCSATGIGLDWFTHQVGGDSVEGDIRVNLVVDGRAHHTLAMQEQKTGKGEWAFSAPFDPSRHAPVLTALKNGSGLYVLIGGASGASLSLRGSSREIDRAFALCSADESRTAPVAERTASPIAGPYDAVKVMMATQNCEATESEIFTAITEAGFGVWDANLFITGNAGDGALELLGETGGTYRYRLAGCTPASSAIAFDPGAQSLTVTNDQLPQPVQEEIGRVVAQCGDALPSGGRDENAVLADDLDGDGTYDFLLDHVLFCPSQHMVLCGASRCPYTLFVSANGDWRRFDFILQGYKELSTEGFLFNCSTAARKAGIFVENGALVKRNCP